MDVVQSRMADEPVIALEGARTVGKSTLLRALAERHGQDTIDLDDLPTREQVRADPSYFVGGEEPVFVDEYQHVPGVLDAIKAELNRNTRPGRFVLAGSTRWDALPRGTQSLTGRLHLIPVQPLAQAELVARPGLISRLVRDDVDLRSRARSTTSRSDYAEHVTAGGLPLALARHGASRSRWFADHISETLQRDTREIAQIRQVAGLPPLLRQLAAQTGQLMNISKAARDSGMDERTANNYVHLLEKLFLVSQLPAWGRTLRSGVNHRPKIHIADSGVTAHLLRLTQAKLAARTASAATEFGHLLETFVYGEVAAQTSWLDEVVTLGHWRTRDGSEVDLVIERADGSVIAIEVKAGGRVTDDQLGGLRALRALLGDQFHCGIALYTGEHSYQASDRFWVVPLDRLWS